MPQLRPGWYKLALVGIAAGAFSGLFGIGGGTLIVPALALWLAVPHKIATGTSVAAILPMAIVGAGTYALRGDIDWIAGVCLAIGAVVGAQIGAALLHRLPVEGLKWIFMVFLAVIIVTLWFVVPQRSDVIDMSVLVALMIVLTGVVTGVFSGLLGIGGGAIVVAVLMFFFGASDLVAKGTSLLMMIPGSVSGTLGNLRHQNVDLRIAAIVGLTSCVSVPFGTMLAAWIPPFWANVAFSVYLTFVLWQMLARKLKGRRPRG